ncbi:hypothetical protein ACHAW6_016047 [Cyclotella cf. meneghiniana]
MEEIPSSSEPPSRTPDELQHSNSVAENEAINVAEDPSAHAADSDAKVFALDKNEDGDVVTAFAVDEAEDAGIDDDPQTEERERSDALVREPESNGPPASLPAESISDLPSTLKDPSTNNSSDETRDNQVMINSNIETTKDEESNEDQKTSSRRSKRPRISVTLTRYSPGEGGGLKRHKAEKDAGEQQHKLMSPDSTEAQIIVKSTASSVEKNNIEDPKKKESALKNSNTVQREKCENATGEHDARKQPWSGPIYSWVGNGVKTANPLPSSHTVESVSAVTNCIIVDHEALSIDFSLGFSGEDNASTTPLAADSSPWKCVKCFHTNVSSKSRCSFCLSWKGRKRDNYPRRSSVDSTAGNSGCGPPQPLVIRVGDDVLISSGDAPWKDLDHLVNRSLTLDSNSEDAFMCYDDPLSRDPGFGVLDPYVARIERMWEEIDETVESSDGAKKKKGSSGKATVPRMMIQTRWYFKREDLEGLNCNLVLDGQTNGVKQRIVSNMTVRDLVLSDQVDSNSVTSILGKANILTLSPTSEGQEKKKLPKGALVCRYRLDLNTDGVTTGTLRPILDSPIGKQEIHASTPSDSVQSKDANRRDVDGISSEDEGNYPPATEVFSSTAYVGQISPTRRVISEGATTMGKIKVGSDHQAVIPYRLDLGKTEGYHPPLERSPMMVWNPALDAGDAVDSFILDACSILSKSLTQTPFHELNCVESPDFETEAGKPREISIDSLLAQLHDCNYDCSKALDKVSTHPANFVTIWNQEERDQFDSSFRVYRDSLRMISKNLIVAKSCKDVVDYHYRFKLVENFRRFKAKKQEQAREMMQTVEYRMLKEKRNLEAQHEERSDEDLSSSEDDGGFPSRSLHKNGPVNNRIRTWFRTGGRNDGNDGAAQRRRNRACIFLTEVKNQVGTDAYLALAKCLKTYNAQCQSSLHDVKASAHDIMKSHPYLFEQFVNEFLPKEIH